MKRTKIVVQVERAVEAISDKVDELALRPEVFGTRLDEHVLQLMAEQKLLLAAIAGLSSTVDRLASGGAAPSAAEPSSGQRTAIGWPDSAYAPALWASVGALAGCLATAAYVRAHRR